MVKETSNLTSEQLYKSFVEQSKKWVKGQAKSIEGHFPTLKDGSTGLIIGWSTTYLYAEVLRPNGELTSVDLTHTGNYKEPDRQFGDRGLYRS